MPSSRGWRRSTLAQVVRPNPAPVPWGRAVEALLAVAVPFGAGLLSGHTIDGLLISLGSLPVANADRAGPYRVRALRMVWAAIAVALGLIIGSAVYGTTWVAIGVVTAGALVAGLVSAAGAMVSLASLNFLIYLAIAVSDPLPRPGWFPAVMALAGGAYVLVLTVPGWLLRRDLPERRAVQGAYDAIANLLEAGDREQAVSRRQGVTAAINAAEDALFTARSAAGGWDASAEQLVTALGGAEALARGATARMRRGRPVAPSVVALVRRLGAAVAESGGRSGPLRARAEAMLAALARPGIGAAEPSPAPPPPGILPAAPSAEPLDVGELDPDVVDDDLRAPLATAIRAVTGTDWPGVDEGRAGSRGGRGPAPKPTAFRPAATPARQALMGRSARTAALRLALCMAAAELLAHSVSHDRPYWIPLTVAVVMKPDFGSVFARALQRAIGTSAGVVVGGVVLALVTGKAELLPFLAVFAFLMPVTLVRNYGMFVTALTPIVLVQIDALTHQAQPLIVGRLLDTLMGCGVVLILGYLPWPDTWRTRLPERYAAASRQVATYLSSALAAPASPSGAPTGGPGAAPSKGPSEDAGASPSGGAGAAPPGAAPVPAAHDRANAVRRGAYRRLADLRTALQQTLSEPRPASDRGRALWPAAVALETILDETTALAARAARTGERPKPEKVEQVTAAMEQVAEAVVAGDMVGRLSLPDDHDLSYITAAVRAAAGAIDGARPRSSLPLGRLHRLRARLPDPADEGGPRAAK